MHMSVSFQCCIASRLAKNPLRPDKGTEYIFDKACVRGSMATSTHKYYPRCIQAKVSYWPAITSASQPWNLPTSVKYWRTPEKRLTTLKS